jgi:hypothetical protein
MDKQKELLGRMLSFASNKYFSTFARASLSARVRAIADAAAAFGAWRGADALRSFFFPLADGCIREAARGSHGPERTPPPAV